MGGEGETFLGARGLLIVNYRSEFDEISEFFYIFRDKNVLHDSCIAGSVTSQEWGTHHFRPACLWADLRHLDC